MLGGRRRNALGPLIFFAIGALQFFLGNEGLGLIFIIVAAITGAGQLRGPQAPKPVEANKPAGSVSGGEIGGATDQLAKLDEQLSSGQIDKETYAKQREHILGSL